MTILESLTENIASYIEKYRGDKSMTSYRMAESILKITPEEQVKNNVALADVRQQSELLPYDRAKDIANCNDCKILGGLCAIHDIGNSA